MSVKASLKSLAELPEGAIAPAKEAQPKVHYPSLRLSSKQLEGIRDIQVDETVYLVIEANVTSVGKGITEWDRQENEDERWANFDLLRAKVQPVKDEADRRVEEEHNLRKVPMSEMLK